MPAATAIPTDETRESEQGSLFSANRIQDFLLAALQHGTLADAT